MRQYVKPRIFNAVLCHGNRCLSVNSYVAAPLGMVRPAMAQRELTFRPAFIKLPFSYSSAICGGEGQRAISGPRDTETE